MTGVRLKLVERLAIFVLTWLKYEEFLHGLHYRVYAMRLKLNRIAFNKPNFLNVTETS